MAEQAPALLLILPLFGALVCFLTGLRNDRLCLPIAILSLASSLIAALSLLSQVAGTGEVQYFLGNWITPRGIGIELRVDYINGPVLVLINAVALIAALYSSSRVPTETPGKSAQFYTLCLLLTTGLLGMTVTADAFNLYVLLEVTSLTGYALVAIGSHRRAPVAAFNYLIIGTVGATLYLLGVGYLYIKTGTLNMAGIQEILTSQNLHESITIKIAFILILLGIGIKMAFFPLHAWLPNAYSFAPSSTACLVAPLMTKVSVYIMIRMMLTVFGPAFVFETLSWEPFVVWAAVIAILTGSFLALGQTDYRRMLCYIIVAEVGYMVGGAWLANAHGMAGALYHVLSDGAMTLCLFLTAGILLTKTGTTSISQFKGLCQRMPVTMAAFTLGAFSMIGIPPTCGFFSKLYLIRGGLEAGRYEFVAALLISSLVNAVLFFRIIELAWFPPLGTGAASTDSHRDAPAPHATARVSEAPASMLAPLLITAASLLLLGLYNQEIISLIHQSLAGYGLDGGKG